MNLQFDTSCMTPREAHGLIALLSNLFPETGQSPLPFSTPSSLPPAPPAPLVPMGIDASQAAESPVTTSEPTPPTPIDQPTTQRKRRTKAEMAADEAAAAQSAQQAQAPPADPTQSSAAANVEASATTQPAPAPPTTVGADELRSLLNGYIAKHSMEEAIGKLREFNCNRVTEALSLPADQLSLLAAALRG